jgi:arylsulfatase A-like enzyme
VRFYGDSPKDNTQEFDNAYEKQLLHGYYACVSYVDVMVGRVLEALDETGLAKNTIVVLWGDRGWHLGELGMWGKSTNYEYSMHAPLMVRTPDIKPGCTSALTDCVDVFPSLCDLCGIEKPDQLEGISFVPLLEDPDRSWSGAAFGQLNRYREVTGYTVRNDRFRLVLWRQGRGKASRNGEILARELYENNTDPEETRNLAGDPQYADMIRELTALLDRDWREARSDF